MNRWIVIGSVVAMLAVYVRALLRIAAQSELEQPLLPQRREMVLRAQQELAAQARRGR